MDFSFFSCTWSSLLPTGFLLLFFGHEVVLTLCNPMDCCMPGSSTISWSLLRFMSIKSVMLSNHLILCSPLLLLPSIFPRIRVFSNESALHIRWPDTSLALSLLYGPTLTPIHDYWKNRSFDYTDFIMSSFVIVFLPRSKHLLISWLQSPSAVILEPKRIKFVTAFTFRLLFAMKLWSQSPLF